MRAVPMTAGMKIIIFVRVLPMSSFAAVFGSKRTLAIEKTTNAVQITRSHATTIKGQIRSPIVTYHEKDCPYAMSTMSVRAYITIPVMDTPLAVAGRLFHRSRTSDCSLCGCSVVVTPGRFLLVNNR